MALYRPAGGGGETFPSNYDFLDCQQLLLPGRLPRRLPGMGFTDWGYMIAGQGVGRNK